MFPDERKCILHSLLEEIKEKEDFSKAGYGSDLEGGGGSEFDFLNPGYFSIQRSDLLDQEPRTSHFLADEKDGKKKQQVQSNNREDELLEGFDQLRIKDENEYETNKENLSKEKLQGN
jgi:predicted  nucleic acid-binding Zn-ribbon protein